MEENKKHHDEERMKRASAADKRRTSALSSQEEALSPNALHLETSTSSMEVDEPSDVEIEESGDNESTSSDDDESESEESEEAEKESPTPSENPSEAESVVTSNTSTDGEDEKNDQLDTTKFFETFDDADRLYHQAATVALVGGSNVPHIQLVSDKDLQVQTHAIWEGGAVINQGAEKVSEVNRDIRDKFDIIVTHLGVCNFPCKGESSVMSHFKDYKDMTNKVRDLCPEAHIVMSGLLPQAGEDRQIANEQIRSFNAALKAVGDDDREPYLHYCDNWPHFVNDDQVLDELFKDPDTYGVHVNDPGSVVLAQSIMERVKQVFYWERLGVPLSPSS